MKRKKYSDEFKQQIIEECRLVGNIALVARRHEISRQTVYSWIKSSRQKGSTESFPRDKEKQYLEVLRRLEKVSTENDMLKKLLAEKELELAILRDLRDKVNPQ
ncbi:transposase [Anoxybacter fermentans]|uniref:Transposase n=1 Tax=Anoxybacter fermentans TaxID=1323375 RepID=A0A3Q9HR66_9FIRM|nr:transposase [Anoxybacter fermentans]